jgi:hypothetical protein
MDGAYDDYDHRNKLTSKLEKENFKWEESTGSRASFSDGDYKTFRKICSRYAKRNKVGIQIFQMVDPGLGLCYEFYYSGSDAMVNTLPQPKEVSNYDYVPKKKIQTQVRRSQRLNQNLQVNL